MIRFGIVHLLSASGASIYVEAELHGTGDPLDLLRAPRVYQPFEQNLQFGSYSALPLD